MTRLAPVTGAVVLIAALVVTHRSSGQQAAAPRSMEGTFEYVGVLRGQGMLAGGRFAFLYEPADGSAPMIGEAGTYRIARDTATHVVTYSTDRARVGTTFLWTPVSWAGDTVSYVVMSEQRQVIGRGRSVRRR